MALAATSMMFSCSSDEPATNGGNQSESKGDLYATLTLSLPQGSRSTTIENGNNTNSSSGFEVGNDSENNVGSVLVVLAKKVSKSDYSFVTYSLADGHKSDASTDIMPIYNVQFETNKLLGEAGKPICVFTYCNPTTQLIEAAKAGFTEGFVNLTGNVETGSNIWAANGFLMSNAELPVEVTLPSETQMNQYYNTPERPFNLGTVKVERASARFDFKETTIQNAYGANCYPIYNQNNIELDDKGNQVNKEKQLMGFVQLDEMALINVAKEYYYLPRVSADGLDTDVTICGIENTTNYVVSPFSALKAASPLAPSTITDNFLYNAQKANGDKTAFNFTDATLKYESLGTNLGEDKDENWNADNKVGYKIWKYLTENTLPKSSDENLPYSLQRKGITTGVAFKGHIVAANNKEDLGQVINGGTKVIYGYNGVLYGDLEMLKAQVSANPVSSLAETFKAQFNVSDLNEETLAGIKTDLTSTIPNGLAIYRPVDGKYPVYYAYYNRHNDNGNNTVMGAMEFGVVRNNVYKLAVNNILEFGHPGNPGDDPDPEDPDDPDESPKTYFRVSVQVLPWVVRVNNIIL